MNTIIQRYTGTGKDLSDILQEHDRRDSLIDTILLLKEFLAGKPGTNGAFLAARNVSVESADPDLFILFLITWAEASFLQSTFIRDRLTQAWALVRKAENLVSSATPPEIVADLKVITATLTGAVGDRVNQEAILRNALTHVSPTAPRRIHILLSLADLYAQTGRLSELEPELQKASYDTSDAVTAGRLLLCRYIDAVETCQWDTARSISGNIDHGLFHGPQLAAFTRSRFVVHLLANATSRGAPSVDLPMADPNLPDWGLVIQCLMDERTEQALRWARVSEKHTGDSVPSTGWPSFNLVRAELVQRHPSAAERVMQLRQAAGNMHYLDHFFLARIAVLEDRLADAFHHITDLVPPVMNHHAEKRLATECRLASELRRDVLFEMLHVAFTQPPERRAPVPTEYHEGRIAPRTDTTSIIGQSHDLAQIRQQVLQLAPLDVSILVTGETGTGKELIARTIHEAGPRKAAPFLAVNCGAISESLLESELFGHEKGAFSGAATVHRGLFEEAGQGTILLDEIGEITPRLQVALLRVLETGEIRPVGSARSRVVHCRIIALTNADLDTLSRQGRFRKDLLYRLRRMAIHVPPLRERKADILPLALYFLDSGRPAGVHATMTDSLREALLQHPWPGNVRELRNAIERMRLLNSDKLDYGAEDLDIEDRVHTSTTQELPESTSRGRQPTADSRRPAPADADSPTPSRSEPWFMDRNSAARNLVRLRRLFREHGMLTRQEIMKAMDISSGTATSYLRKLCSERTVNRIQPTRSPRSVYFQSNREQTGR